MIVKCNNFYILYIFWCDFNNFIWPNLTTRLSMIYREKVTRHLYYLQLKDNVLNYHHGGLEEKCFQIAGYALQADYGNHQSAQDIEGYFDPREYFPAWVCCVYCDMAILNFEPYILNNIELKTLCYKYKHTRILIIHRSQEYVSNSQSKAHS